MRIYSIPGRAGTVQSSQEVPSLKAGTAIVMDPNSGEILAMASVQPSIPINTGSIPRILRNRVLLYLRTRVNLQDHYAAQH
jgi:cell division protein FtsI/penicillin-binding protein 2